jgi:pimeloyl-ACP methyl ester carboxylesterase
MELRKAEARKARIARRARKTILALVALTALVGTSGCASTESSLKDYGSRGSCFTQLNGTRIHYEDHGAGDEALVFVHGWSCDSTFWRFQIDAFARSRRVLLVDLPGHGESEAPATACTINMFADAVAAAMDDAGVGRAVLVGHSNGAPVVRQFYRQYRERTLGLVILEGALKSLFTPEQAEDWKANFSGDDYRKMTANMTRRMLTPKISYELQAEIIDRMTSTTQQVMIESMVASTDPALWTEDPIEVPLLVVLADSPFWDDEYEDFVRRLAPEVTYRIMYDVGHFLMMEEPDEFNHFVETFLEKHELLTPAAG